MMECCEQTRAQVRTFLGQVTAPRFRALWTLTYGCGLRIGEAVKLEVRDIQSAHRRIHLREAKGGKHRFVPLPAPVLTELREFWKSHRHTRWLFLGAGCAWRVCRSTEIPESTRRAFFSASLSFAT